MEIKFYNDFSIAKTRSIESHELYLSIQESLCSWIKQEMKEKPGKESVIKDTIKNAIRTVEECYRLHIKCPWEV